MSAFIDDTILIIAVAALLSVSSIANAQSPPKDSLGDTTRRATCPDCGELAFLAAAAKGVLFLAAPAGLLLLSESPSDSARPRAPADFAVAYATAGIAGDTGQNWLHSADVEVLRHDWFGELRVETFYIPRRFQYETVRVGRFTRAGSLTGGLTLGFQWARDDRAQQGVEVGLPLIIGGPRARVLSEASYVVSSKTACITYRLQGELGLFHSSLFLGANVELKTLRSQNPFTGGVALLVGVRE
jgi:hypothetical protein